MFNHNRLCLVLPSRNRWTVLRTVTEDNKIMTRYKRLIYIGCSFVRISIPSLCIGLFGHCVFVCAHIIAIIIFKRAQLLLCCVCDADNNIVATSSSSSLLSLLRRYCHYTIIITVDPVRATHDHLKKKQFFKIVFYHFCFDSVQLIDTVITTVRRMKILNLILLSACLAFLRFYNVI